MEQNNIEEHTKEDCKKEKKCFVITAIGEENTEIRRHITGVINAAIRPVLEKEYEVKVAHESCSIGSITNEVIVDIYESDLVIANLTGLNPNVMYELAIRHATRKPVIQIMEKNSAKLPFDITTERTIFYVNDFSGLLDLKEKLKNMVDTIGNNDISNPIYDALKEYLTDKSLIETVEKENVTQAGILERILYKLNRIDKVLNDDSKFDFENFNIVGSCHHIEILFTNNIKLTNNVKNKVYSAFLKCSSFLLITINFEKNSIILNLKFKYSENDKRKVVNEIKLILESIFGKEIKEILIDDDVYNEN